MAKIDVSILEAILLVCCSRTSEAQTEDELKKESGRLEEKIKFLSLRDTLVGYLSKPDKVSKFPVIVVLHSAGQGHHDTNFYNHLERTLNKIGVGVFTYDRRGAGESGDDSKTSSFEVLANDALVAIEILKRRKDIDSGRISVAHPSATRCAGIHSCISNGLYKKVGS